MPLYEITADAFRSITEASLAEMKLRERGDLQRLLRAQVEVLGDDLYVIAEEFGDWEDSRRRIDLLAVDKNANLVVIELKRTTDGGHMELQSIRSRSEGYTLGCCSFSVWKSLTRKHWPLTFGSFWCPKILGRS